MSLLESLKKPFLTQNKEIKNPSITVNNDNVIKDLDDNEIDITFFSNLNSGLEWEFLDKDRTLLNYQNKVIEMYRKLALKPDVNNAIDQIVNEITFTIYDKPFKISVNEENDKIKQKIYDIFEVILNKMNIKTNFHEIVRQMYIDGQLNLALTYENNDIKSGIKKIEIIEPINFYYNKNTNKWKYFTENEDYLYAVNNKENVEYSNEEIVHVDYGLRATINLDEERKGRVNLGYLENAFKHANQLETLENMLVPMRYSRSVMRRLFNIDVADLPPKRAKETVKNIRNEFSYKKVYDVSKGTITKLKNTMPLVEDYWLSNRSGGKGTTVDTMSETNANMNLDDIVYVSKKLYTSLKIPTSRNPYVDDQGGDFSYDTDSTTGENLQFFLHIDRLSIPIIKMLKEVLKREIISTNTMTEQEFQKYEDKIDIKLANKSIFLENMEKDLFIKTIGNWQEVKEEIGKIISLETAAKMVFNWSSEDIESEMQKIKKEKNNEKFKDFYTNDEDY